MSKDATYYLHQTPADLARDLINSIPITPEDILYEPFRGEGAFYNAFPAANPSIWSEITEGRDYRDTVEPYDWVITNPPFKLDTGGKQVNAFWYLVEYYIQRARKGIAFLANDSCFCTLTPRRMDILKERGWSITKITVCSVKKWRGRYFLIILQKTPSTFFASLPTNY